MNPNALHLDSRSGCLDYLVSYDATIDDIHDRHIAPRQEVTLTRSVFAVVEGSALTPSH